VKFLRVEVATMRWDDLAGQWTIPSESREKPARSDCRKKIDLDRQATANRVNRGKPSGDIRARTEGDAVVLTYRLRSPGAAEWKPIEQRVPITWTPCHFGGNRPWFTCSVYSGGRYCGQRVAVLYGAGELFACRHCYGLAYESQQQSPMGRSLDQAQKIRLRLAGSPCTFDAFPGKPPRMHWRTYRRLADRAEKAEATFHQFLKQRFSLDDRHLLRR
jgi:hypothetical protein